MRTSYTNAALSLFVYVCLPFIVYADDSDETEQVLALLTSMERAWAEVSDYTKEVEKTERLVDGSVTQQTVLVKFRRPGQYYMRVLEGPKKGSELIYPKSENEPLAIAHAGGFKGGLSRFLRGTVVLRPLVPTEFSLQDPQVINGQHQTVVDSNLGRTTLQIAKNLREAVGQGEGRMRLELECPESGECLHRIDVELPATAGQVHEVQPGESLWTLSSQYDCPMYVIWYSNPQMRKPDDIRPGQQIFVPRYYAASGHIWVSQQTNFLTRLEIFDKEGELYERYVYLDIQTNVGLTDLDFDTENPDYEF